MKQKGFTLIELLVVVAIIGILASVGVVAYNGYTSAAKKNATKANHEIIIRYMQNTTSLCEIDSSAELMNLKGTNLLNCSDLLESSNPQGKINGAMKTYFEAKIKNVYDSNMPAIHTGRYQGSCYPNGHNPKSWGGLNEQGVHHLVVGWWPNQNRLTLYLDTCIESSGVALSKEFNIRE